MWTCRATSRIPIRNFSASSKSTSGKKSTTTRDNRIAGRLRFYKQVDVKAVEAPWKTTVDKDDATTVVQSPISAGVDGTDSASGVHRPSFSSPSTTSGSNVVHMLTPRVPGINIRFTIDTMVWSNIGWTNNTNTYGTKAGGSFRKTCLHDRCRVGFTR